MLDKKGVLEGVVPESWEVSDLRLVGEAASSPTAVLVLDLGLCCIDLVRTPR
jgi:hypothetical protein